MDMMKNNLGPKMHDDTSPFFHVIQTVALIVCETNHAVGKPEIVQIDNS